MEAFAVGLLLAGALIPVLLPLFRPPLIALREGGGPAAHLRALERRKAEIYSAIREVGFDLRTDKLSQEDYQSEVTTLKAEAVEVVGEIEVIKSVPPRGSTDVEARVAAARRKKTDPVERTSGVQSFCTQCGHEVRPTDRFCGGCGQEQVR
jgi:hypothetical protein